MLGVCCARFVCRDRLMKLTRLHRLITHQARKYRRSLCLSASVVAVWWLIVGLPTHRCTHPQSLGEGAGSVDYVGANFLRLLREQIEKSKWISSLQQLMRRVRRRSSSTVLGVATLSATTPVVQRCTLTSKTCCFQQQLVETMPRTRQ